MLFERPTLGLIELLEIHIDICNPLSHTLPAVSVTTITTFPNDHLGRRIDLRGVDQGFDPKSYGINGILTAVKAGMTTGSHETAHPPIAPVIETVLAIEYWDTLAPV